MKYFFNYIIILFLLSASFPANATQTVLPAYQTPTGTSPIIVSPTTPLPIRAYDSSSTAGSCLVSNGTYFVPGSCAGTAGVASINSVTGAFTFTGSGVTCTSTTCTFSGGGGGSVSVTAGTPDVVITPTPGTGTFTVGTQSLLVQLGTTTPYTVVATDMGKTDTHSNGSSAVAVTLPQSTTTGFGVGAAYTDLNLGTGKETITPTTSTINGNSSIGLWHNGWNFITSDGTNYYAIGYPGVGTVTTNTISKFIDTSGAVTASSLVDNGTVISTLEPMVIGSTVVTTGAALDLGTNPTLALLLPTGTTGQRPTGTAGFMRYNSTTPTVEAYFNGQWNAWATGSGGTGGGTFNYADNALTLTANTYFVPVGGGGAPSTTEASVSVKSPSALTSANLQVSVSAAPGAGNTYAITLRDNGSSTALTCTISGASATTCQDLTHSVNVAQNDVIDWQLVSAGTLVGTPNLNITANSGTTNVGVTSVSVATANGFSGTVANATTTPAITIIAGNITPTSVVTTGPIVCGVQTVAVSGAAIATNYSSGCKVYATMANSATTTISAPSNPIDGGKLLYALTQGTSSTVTWNAIFDFGASGAPTLSVTATKVDYVGFSYDANLTKWVYLGSQLGN